MLWNKNIYWQEQISLYLMIELFKYAPKPRGSERIAFIFLQPWLLSQMLFEFKIAIFL